jgi:photosystem II stability/assembly factor-like uncharacterized protein
MANTGLPAAAVGAVTVASDGTIYASVGGEPRLFQLTEIGAHWESLGRLPEDDSGSLSVYDIAVVDEPDALPVLVVTTYDRFFVSRGGGRDDSLTWERMAGEGLPWVSYRRLAPMFSTDFAERGVAHLVYGGRIYRTEDGGDSWTRIEGTLSVEKLLESPAGRLIAVASRGVYVQDPSSEMEWKRRQVGFGFGDEPIAARFITEQLAVAVMGSTVFLSEDGGRIWTRIGQSALDQAYGYLISPRFDADGAIYARGAAAIYVSADAGRTWVEAGDGLPPCDYYDSPECDVTLVDAVPSDGHYTVYAVVRHDFHTCLWAARTKED